MGSEEGVGVGGRHQFRHAAPEDVMHNAGALLEVVQPRQQRPHAGLGMPCPTWHSHPSACGWDSDFCGDQPVGRAATALAVLWQYYAHAQMHACTENMSQRLGCWEREQGLGEQGGEFTVVAAGWGPEHEGPRGGR